MAYTETSDILVLLLFIIGALSKTRLQEIARTTGLEINVDKTMCLRINPGNTQSIDIGGQAIEGIDTCTYLGSIVSKTEGTEEDIMARIEKARHAFATLGPVWKNHNIYLKTKLRLFNSNVKTVLLYDTETWRRTKRL